MVYADSWPYSTLGEPVGIYDAITAKASGAITKGQIVKLSAATVPPDGPVVATAGAGDIPFGVAMQDIADGKTGKILKRGRVKVRAGGAISVGDHVKAGATGYVVTAIAGVIAGTTAVLSHAATGLVDGFLACGVAETAAVANGDDLLISFLRF